MSKNKTWAPPGWPWEMDLLTLFFVALALGAPYYYFNATETTTVAQTLEEQQHVLWAIGIVVLSVMHVAVAAARLEAISTPILYLLSPPAFAVLAYYRTFKVLQGTGQQTLLTGSVQQYALVVGSVLLLSLVMSRIRMARHMLRYRDIKWDIVCKSAYDSSYFALLTEFKPLAYPPRLLRACSEGILLEGWFYLAPFPFDRVQGIAPITSARRSANGHYLTSSTRTMVRIELLGNVHPFYISPERRDEFLSYCNQHLARLRPASMAGHTHAGATRSASATRGTRSGMASQKPRGT